MAAELISSVAVKSVTAAFLVMPVRRRIRYLFRFKTIVEILQESARALTIKLMQVHADANDSERQNLVSKDYVMLWLTMAEKKLDYVQSLERRIEKNKRRFRWNPNWIGRYQLSKEIDKTIEEIDELLYRAEIEGEWFRDAPAGIDFFKSKEYLASQSSASAIQEIEKALKPDGVNIILLFGMRVLISNIVREVDNKAKRLKLFNKTIFVVVSQTPDIGKIQDEIADQLALNFQKTTQKGKAVELWLRLKKEKKVLIVLEDLWNGLDFEEIGIPFDCNHNGCKIILTTHCTEVCAFMKSQVKVQLGALDEKGAWILFKINASLENASSDIINVAKEILKECKGQAITIVTLARALRCKDFNGWKLALSKLKSLGSMDVNEKIVNLILEISYYHLRRETKECFSLCASYPKGYSIEVEDLVKYAWGLRIYRNADSVDEVRSEVLEAINDLKKSHFLLEDDNKRYIKMHDMFHDVVKQLTASKEDNSTVTKPEIGSENESSRQKEEILVLDNFDCRTTIEFEGLQKLEVLNLMTTSQSNDRFFSLNALKSLKNLRALKLKGFKHLEDISTLAKISGLEILSLHSSEFQDSMDKLGELTNLRVLDIRQCIMLGFPSNLIQRLVKLEELYLCDLTIKGGVFGVTSSTSTAILPELNFLPRLALLSLDAPSLHFPEGFVFPRLQRYEIAINVRRLENPKAIISSRSLRISEGLPLKVISELLRDVEFLGVSHIMEKDIKCLTDTSPGNVPVAMVLQNIKEVRIEKCRNLEVIFQMKEVENSPLLLSKLKDLYLWELPNLVYVWKMPTNLISLRGLEALKIDSCGKLKSLFSFSLAQTLVCLQLLQIDGCGELEEIIEELDSDDKQEISPATNLDKSLRLPKLMTLEIHNCDRLEYILPNFMAAGGLPQLKRLSIENLPALKQICRPAKRREENGTMPHQHQLLVSLTDLKVSNCPVLNDAEIQSETVRAYFERVRLLAFKEFLRHTKHLTLNRIMGKNLVPDTNLEELTSLKLEDCKDLECLVDAEKEHFRKENEAQILSILTFLELTSLPELKWVLKGRTPNGSLESLKVVSIINCNKLESLFSASAIQTLWFLEELKIRYCDKLESVVLELESNEDQIELNTICLPNLKTVEIDGCPRLEYLFPLALAQGLPRLQRVQLRCLTNLSRFIAKDDHITALDVEVLEVYQCPRLRNFRVQQEVNKWIPLVVQGIMNSRNQMNNRIQVTKLGELRLYGCNRLTYIFSSLRNLPQLRILDIFGCDNLKEIITSQPSSQGPDGDEIGSKDDKEMKMFPRLKELRLEDMPSLETFIPVGYHLRFPSLEYLDIKNCSKMITSFKVDPTFPVLATTKATRLVDASSSEGDIFWKRPEPVPTSQLPQNVEETNERHEPGPTSQLPQIAEEPNEIQH